MQRTTFLAISLTFPYYHVSGAGMDPVRLDREYYLYIWDIHTGYLVVSSHDCVSCLKALLLEYLLVRVISHLSVICLIIDS